MVSCTAFGTLKGFADYLVWPSTCTEYFYLPILIVLIVVIGWAIYKGEETRTGAGDLIGGLAISSLAISVLSVFGSLIKSTAGIAMISSNIIIDLFAVTLLFVLVWIFKKS